MTPHNVEKVEFKDLTFKAAYRKILDMDIFQFNFVTTTPAQYFIIIHISNFFPQSVGAVINYIFYCVRMINIS